MTRVNDSARTLVFDLDGTLAETAPDLMAALNFVLVGEGVAPVPIEATCCSQRLPSNGRTRAALKVPASRQRTLTL